VETFERELPVNAIVPVLVERTEPIANVRSPDEPVIREIWNETKRAVSKLVRASPDTRESHDALDGPNIVRDTKL
jgi:hypothetical protein